MGTWFILWLIIGFIALFIDIVTSTFLFMWFTVGAIAAAIANYIGYNLTIQTIIFVVVSALFMAVGYPIVKRTLKKTVVKTPTMEESYIGRILIAESDFSDKTSMKFEGIYWTLRNSGNEIKKGDKLKITGLDGNKLVVKKV